MRLAGVMVVVVAMIVSACVRNLVVNPDYKTTVDGVLSVAAKRLKERRKHYDIDLLLRAESNNSLIIMLRDIQCYEGKSRGEVKDLVFSALDRSIPIPGGKNNVITLNLRCTVGEVPDGVYKIVIDRVYENTKDDGITKGKIVAEKVTWELPRN